MFRLALAASLGLMLSAPAPAQVGRGETAPNFEAEFLGLDAHSLADLKGRVVLLEFWRTW